MTSKKYSWTFFSNWCKISQEKKQCCVRACYKMHASNLSIWLTDTSSFRLFFARPQAEDRRRSSIFPPCKTHTQFEIKKDLRLASSGHKIKLHFTFVFSTEKSSRKNSKTLCFTCIQSSLKTQELDMTWAYSCCSLVDAVLGRVDRLFSRMTRQKTEIREQTRLSKRKKPWLA